jgi:hypothetical protein
MAATSMEDHFADQYAQAASGYLHGRPTLSVSAQNPFGFNPSTVQTVRQPGSAPPQAAYLTPNHAYYQQNPSLRQPLGKYMTVVPQNDLASVMQRRQPSVDLNSQDLYARIRAWLEGRQRVTGRPVPPSGGRGGAGGGNGGGGGGGGGTGGPGAPLPHTGPPARRVADPAMFASLYQGYRR